MVQRPRDREVITDEHVVPSQALTSFVEEELCYERSDFENGKLLGDRLFYLGGPGITNNNAACVWP